MYMPFSIVNGDITKISCDAIVNAANSSLLGGGGVDGAIHSAAGRGLYEECLKLNGCGTGEAKITRGYKLPAKYVIHTVGPVWRGGTENEESLLRSCYSNSLKLALENKCESVAFPLISSGVYGYPYEEAFSVAVDEIRRFLDHNDMEVVLVIYDRFDFNLRIKPSDELCTYIDSNYRETNEKSPEAGICFSIGGIYEPEKPGFGHRNKKSETAGKFSLDDYSSIDLSESPECSEQFKPVLDESFTQMLLRLIDERNIKDSDCYKRANIDRRLFSKIRSDIHYSPSKITVIQFAVALELDIDETKEFLLKAGYALSPSNYFDVIISFYIEKGIYDVFTINETLFLYDQPQLV